MRMTFEAHPPLFLVLLIGVFLLQAFSASSSEEEQPLPAKAQFDLGLKHYQHGDTLKALSAFEASYHLRKSPTALFNIAMCQNALFRYIESYENFRLLLDEHEASLDVEMKSRAKKAMTDILGKVGLITLVGLPESARVTLDGKEQSIAADGSLPVEPGSHTLAILTAGYPMKEIALAITQGGQSTIDASLEPEPVKPISEESPSVDAEPAPQTPLPQLSPVSSDLSTTGVLPKKAAAKSREKGLFVSGLALSFVGLAGIGVGIGAGIDHRNRYNDVLSLIDKTNEAVDGGDHEAFDAYYREAAAEMSDFKNDEPKYRISMIAGFVAGGLFTVTGSVLLSLYTKKTHKERPVALRPAPSGVVLTF